MAPTPPLPQPLWKAASPELLAGVLALVQAYEDRLALLENRLGDLERRLKIHSTNSSQPPSSDPIGMKRKPPAPPSGKTRRGQPGHKKARRLLVPPETVRETFDCKPDASPVCRATTGGALPGGVPTGSFGPYLQAVLAMFAGAYRLSERPIRQVTADRFTLSISTGMISKLERQSAAVLDAPYRELAIAVHHAPATNIDETSWRERLKKVWLWAKVTPLFTVFTVAKTRSGDVAKALLGTEAGPVVGCERFSADAWIMARWRQICWAHLRRDFQARIDRGGRGEATGRQLLSLSNRWFPHGHRVRDGTLEWSSFQTPMSGLRAEVKQALRDGSRCPCPKTAATCFEILKVEEGLWTFARVKGIEPTNDAVERAWRHAVIWRRLSGGTESVDGSRFVERMRTVVATCRHQGRNVLDDLTTCFEADCRGQTLASLLPVATAETEAA